VGARATGGGRGPVEWLIAPDKFKGTHSALQVARALARGVGNPAQVDLCPLADGGDGTAEILLDALGGELLSHPAHDPLGRPIGAAIALLDAGACAVVEVASASGLVLLAESERDAEAASTTGTGELIIAALATGARTVVVAAGGSASTDGGEGAIAAIERGGGLRGARLIVLADVSIPFERAAEVFAPQKGADRDAIARLAARLTRAAQSMPRDPRGMPMGGAAGGLAGGLWAHYDARMVLGSRWILDAVGFQGRLARARAVITGEGRLDATTLHGKAVFEVAARCARGGVPLHAVVGSSTLSRAERERIVLASIRAASTLEDLEAAGRAIAAERDGQ
jgi:glycerate 2-kinase